MPRISDILDNNCSNRTYAAANSGQKLLWTLCPFCSTLCSVYTVSIVCVGCSFQIWRVLDKRIFKSLLSCTFLCHLSIFTSTSLYTIRHCIHTVWQLNYVPYRVKFNEIYSMYNEILRRCRSLSVKELRTDRREQRYRPAVSSSTLTGMQSGITATMRSAVFGIPFHASISHTFRKFQPKVISGQLKWPYLKQYSWLRRDYSC